MPRRVRLDKPGTLQHVIIRGIEKGDIVTDDMEQDDFVDRLWPLRSGIIKDMAGIDRYLCAVTENA